MTADEQSLAALVETAVQAEIAAIKAAQADGKITLPEIWELITTAIGNITAIVHNVGSYNPNIRKTVVLEAADKIYTDVLAAIQIPGVPAFLQPMLAASLRSVYDAIVASIYDAIVKAISGLVSPIA